MSAVARGSASNVVVRHPAKEQGIRLFEDLARVTMQLFVGEHRAIIAAPVQGDIDRLPKVALRKE